VACEWAAGHYFDVKRTMYRSSSKVKAIGSWSLDEITTQVMASPPLMA